MPTPEELFAKSEFDHKREHPEYHETVRMADWLRGEIHNGRNVLKTTVPFPGLRFTHMPAEAGDRTAGFFSKRMGLDEGWHDFIFLWGPPANIGFIEMKAEGRKQRQAQKDFDFSIAAMGFTNRAVCYFAEEVRDHLIAWGNRYIPVNIPPRKPTRQEKMNFSMEMLRP